MYPLITFFVSALAVLTSTPLVQRLGLKFGYVDLPGKRKVHQHPIVRVGGIAIFGGTLSALLFAAWLGGFGNLPDSEALEVWGLLVGSLGFFLIGLADDIFQLPPLTRLLLQAIVASLAWSMGVRVEYLPIHFGGAVPIGILSLPITIIWLAGVTNAINWIDGLDGLAAGVSAIAASVLFIVCWQHHPTAALIALALFGATLGFLRYNANPAKIFMGDGGAYFIGFTLAGVCVIGLMKDATLTAVVLPYIILAVPGADMVRVILARLMDGKSPFFADQNHLHHRLLKAGLSAQSTVWVIYGLTLWVGSWAIALSGIGSELISTISTTLLLGFLLWFPTQQLWKQVQSIQVEPSFVLPSKTPLPQK
jgi:UDP-GlcNAc:undecaprenyl-phosphate GlcNAc-1-phosphate transferase